MCIAIRKVCNVPKKTRKKARTFRLSDLAHSILDQQKNATKFVEAWIVYSQGRMPQQVSSKTPTSKPIEPPSFGVPCEYRTFEKGIMFCTRQGQLPNLKQKPPPYLDSYIHKNNVTEYTCRTCQEIMRKNKAAYDKKQKAKELSTASRPAKVSYPHDYVPLLHARAR